MSPKKLEALARKYGNYAIIVDEEKKTVIYFTDNVDLGASDFITFAPWYRIASGSTNGVVMEGQILTFPSHNVERIMNYVIK
jgi:hypothetical protein